MAKVTVKIKTATITVYHIFGTKGSYAADVFYRGVMIHTNESHSIKESAESAKTWAIANGYNRVKISLN